MDSGESNASGPAGTERASSAAAALWQRFDLRYIAGAVTLLIIVAALAIGGGDSDGDDGSAATATTLPRSPGSTASIADPGATKRETPPEGVAPDPASLLVLVDRTRNLPEDYVPAGLAEAPIPWAPSNDAERRMLRPEAAAAAAELFAAADRAKVPLSAISGYRSYKTQVGVHDRSVERNGAEDGDRSTAQPGHSEHQTGLALDVADRAGTCVTEACFATLPEGRWVAENAHTYGFIVRYPADAEDITGYTYSRGTCGSSGLRPPPRSTRRVRPSTSGWALPADLGRAERAQRRLSSVQ